MEQGVLLRCLSSLYSLTLDKGKPTKGGAVNIKEVQTYCEEAYVNSHNLI